MNLIQNLLHKEIGYKNKNLINGLPDYKFYNIYNKNKYILDEINDDIFIDEMLVTDFLVFILLSNKKLYIFNKLKSSLLDCLNINEERIESIFKNTSNNTIIILSLNKYDNYNKMYGNYIPIDIFHNVYIKKNSKLSINDYRNPLFNSIQISYPGFIEFDYESGIVITYESPKIFRIWEINNYKEIFKIDDIDILEFKSSFNKILYYQIEEINSQHYDYDIIINNNIISWDFKVCVTIYDLFDNKLINEHKLYLPYGKTINLPNDIYIEFIEVLDKYLFVKYTYHNIIILNTETVNYCVINHTETLISSDILFLPNKTNFIYFNNPVCIYNMLGEKTVNLNINLLHPYSGIKYVNSDFNKFFLILLTSKNPYNSIYKSSLTIYSLNTMKIITEISNSNFEFENPSNIYSIYYDELNNDILLGFKSGEIFRIGN